MYNEFLNSVGRKAGKKNTHVTCDLSLALCVDLWITCEEIWITHFPLHLPLL